MRPRECLYPQVVGICERAGLSNRDYFEDRRDLHGVERIRKINLDIGCVGLQGEGGTEDVSIAFGSSWDSFPQLERPYAAADIKVVDRAYRPARCIQTSAIAMGRTPPVGFVVAMRQQSSSCGKCGRRPQTVALTRRRSTVEQAVCKRRGAHMLVCPSARLADDDGYDDEYMGV